MLQVVKKLRLEENFNGYIHLKTIPGASPELIHEAGLYADRMSINLEMPTEIGLKTFAPEKSHQEVQKIWVWSGTGSFSLKMSDKSLSMCRNMCRQGRPHKW